VITYNILPNAAPGFSGKAVLTVLHLQKDSNAGLVVSHHHVGAVEWSCESQAYTKEPWRPLMHSGWARRDFSV